MQRHGWIVGITVTALLACSGQSGLSNVPHDAAPPPSNNSGRAPTQHRPVAEVCTEPAPPGSCPVPKSANTGSCGTDADCADAGLSGRCVEQTSARCSCIHDECTVDADCSSGNVCSCRSDPYNFGPHGNPNGCVPGNCRIDSDCGAGGYCSPSVASNVYGISGYYCHTAQDACIDDSDCGATGSDFCAFSPNDGRWECIVVSAPF